MVPKLSTIATRINDELVFVDVVPVVVPVEGDERCLVGNVGNGGARPVTTLKPVILFPIERIPNGVAEYTGIFVAGVRGRPIG